MGGWIADRLCNTRVAHTMRDKTEMYIASGTDSLTGNKPVRLEGKGGRYGISWGPVWNSSAPVILKGTKGKRTKRQKKQNQKTSGFVGVDAGPH